MNDFIKRYYMNNHTNELLSFNQLITHSNISIILGEPASGKTSQLEEYEKNNTNSKLLKLKMLSKYNIDSSINIYLIDSIDEALLNQDRDELILELMNFIKDNNNKKFIITSRYLEFKKYFKKEFKEIEDNYKVYEIQKLSDSEINSLLNSKNIDKEYFWNFIKKNHIKELLKNIVITMYLVENFKSKYIDANKTYIDIYKDLIKEYITGIGKNREEKKELATIDVEKRILIASSLATYMTLDSKLEIDENDKSSILSDNLYKISENIKPQDLKLILESSLFVKEDEKISFFHKSIQEYLTAYFIYDKNLDFETIKELFAHKFGFYTEFEEVIVFLVSFDNYLFNEFIKFDPFIFRRATNLTIKQQELLVIEILRYLQDDYLKTRIELKYLRDSSLYHIKLENIVNLLKEHIDIQNITKQTYQYILGIFQYEDSQELEDFILSILNFHNNNPDYLLELINSDEVKNINDTFGDEKYRKLLLKFILDNNLIDKNIDDIKNRIFNTLYQKIDFNLLLPIFTSKNQHKAFMYYHSMVKRLTSNELVQIFNELLKNNNIKLKDDNLTIIFLYIFKNYADLYNKISLVDLDKMIITNMKKFLLIHSADDVASYKNIKIENLIGDKEKINIPFSIYQFFDYINSLDSAIEKLIVKPKEKQLTLKEIENKIKHWIKNQELDFSDELYLAMRNIETIDLSNKDFLIEEFKLLYKREYLLLKLDIQTVILQIIALDKNSYDFFKIFWIEDIKNNYFYFRYMVQSDTNQAIDDFRKIIWENKASINIFKDDEKLDILKTTRIDRNILKYILTSMGYIKINKRQYNFVANINDITDENLEFLIVNYYDSFNPYKVPQNGYRLDDYAVMNNVISTIFKKMEIDVKRTILLDKFILSGNMYLKTISSRTLNAFYEYERKNRNIDNDYYKNIFKKEQVMEDKKIINNYGQYIEGDNKGDMKQENTSTKNYYLDDKEKNWYDHWIVKFVLAITVTVVGGIILKIFVGE